MDLQLAGKRAIVTGASRGIGYAVATDTTDDHAVRALADRAVTELGGVDILVNGLVTAAEVADVVTFLASPRSVAITGDAIAVGGGTRHAARHSLLVPEIGLVKIGGNPGRAGRRAYWPRLTARA